MGAFKFHTELTDTPPTTNTVLRIPPKDIF